MLVCNACPLGNACCLNKKSLFLNTTTRTTQADSLAEVVEACEAIFYPDPGWKVRTFDSSWPDVTGSGGSTLSASQASSSCTSLLSPPSSSMAVKHGPSLLTLKKRTQAFKIKRMRKLIRISYMEHQTNDGVRSESNLSAVPFEPLLTAVKRRKLAWFGRVTRHDSFSKIIRQGN